mgnify:CR=1 FL=1
MIMLIALILGLAIPAGVIFIVNFMRYKIEGHDDVAKLTSLPILADVAIASETAKTKADIVVHENQNNQMEEIFRSMRTNLQFMLKEGQKVIMFTSSTSGEGKTFRDTQTENKANKHNHNALWTDYTGKLRQLDKFTLISRSCQ